MIKKSPTLSRRGLATTLGGLLDVVVVERREQLLPCHSVVVHVVVVVVYDVEFSASHTI